MRCDGVRGAWPEAFGRKRRILNKPVVTVDTDPPFKGWQGVQAILSLSIFSFTCFKKGSSTTGDDQICFFPTENISVAVLKHSPPFHAYLKIYRGFASTETHRSTLPKITWLCCCQHIILPAGNHFPLQGRKERIIVIEQF